MQLGRYQVSTLRPPPILSISFSIDGRLFAIATETGYEVWRTYPLALIRRRVLPGTLALAVPLPHSPLLLLQGGGNAPLYPPNKAVIYHDGLGQAVAELEFSERIRGIAVRSSTVVIALRYKVLAFKYGQGDDSSVAGKPEDGGIKGEGVISGSSSAAFWIQKIGEWETFENKSAFWNSILGLVAIATTPGSTLLALPGRQAGHVQLVHLPPCPSLNETAQASRTTSTGHFRSPIILAHTHPLSTLSCTATGSHILTTSERGTLLRVWDTARGRLERELRRGVDRAEMWGVTFEDAVFLPNFTGQTNDDDKRREEGRRKGGRVVGWSDKGTVHVWESEDVVEAKKAATNQPSLAHLLSRNLPLPKYFSSPPSFAQYHLPRKNPHAFQAVVGAAAGKAGVTSLKTPELGVDDESERFVVGWIEVEIETEQSSEFIEHIELPIEKKRSSGLHHGLSSGTGSGPLMGMGTREERRSFGSETTSRTVTPTPVISTKPVQGHSRRRSAEITTSRNTPTPTSNRPIRQSSLSQKPQPGSAMTSRRGSSSGVSHHPNVSTSTSPNTSRSKNDSVPRTRTKIERQIVAITYSGDWYRLRIPDYEDHEKDKDKDKEKDDVEVVDGRGGNESKSKVKGKRGKCELVEYRRLGVGGGGW